MFGRTSTEVTNWDDVKADARRNPVAVRVRRLTRVEGGLGLEIDRGEGRPGIGDENCVRSIDVRFDVDGRFNFVDVFDLRLAFVWT